MGGRFLPRRLVPFLILCWDSTVSVCSNGKFERCPVKVVRFFADSSDSGGLILLLRFGKDWKTKLAMVRCVV